MIWEKLWGKVQRDESDTVFLLKINKQKWGKGPEYLLYVNL
jgi:hypothetical protein